MQAKCKDRRHELGHHGIFSPQINQMRLEAYYHVELLQKLKLETLNKVATRLVDASTPPSMHAQVAKSNSFDTFEHTLDQHIRDKEESLKTERQHSKKSERRKSDRQTLLLPSVCPF